VILPAEPVYCRATPHDALPCLRKPVSSITSQARRSRKNRIVIRQVINDIVPYDVARGISVPIPATQDRLPPPWAGIASRLRAHPTGLAPLISRQAFQEQTCIRRNTLLREQRTYPLLDLSKRRRPHRKRLLNRRCPRPRSPNHGAHRFRCLPKKQL